MTISGTRALLAGALLAAVLSPAAPAQASVGISQRLGFDSCMQSVEHMGAFWNNTPFSNFGLYIGGADLGCRAPDAAWVASVQRMGWKFMPIWVGPQAPCSKTEPVRMSADPAKAYQEGRAEALASYRRLKDLGMDTDGTPVTYDLEAFDTSDSACLTAVKSLVRGWVDQLHEPPAQKAGLYGSTCGSGLSAFAGASPPDFIYGAAWDGNKRTSVMPCVASGQWTNHQRHKQYAGPHEETWNGVRLNIDSDCSDGPVYPGPDELDTGQGCVGPATSAGPVDAALVTPTFGWVLTGDALLLSRDGGATLKPAPLELPKGERRAAHFTADGAGWVAAVAPGGIIVARTKDAGVTWTSTQLPSEVELSSLRVTFGSPERGALLAQVATSKAVSRAVLYTTTDAGRTWTPAAAPAAGEVSMEPSGRIRLAGGANGDELHTTLDGRTWTRSPGGATAAVAPPATGAPAGARHVSFAGARNGWALASSGRCTDGKRGCSLSYELLATTNGGVTWRPMKHWRHEIG